MAALKGVVPLLQLFGLAAVFTLAPLPAALGAESVTIRGLTFINKGLVGVGRLPASLRDKFGETFGSGSGLAADPKSWTRTSAGYSGVLYMLPDRGYNLSGTNDYIPRINRLSLALTPIADPTGFSTTDLRTSITANLDDTILLIDSAGAPLTGLDSEEGGIRVAGNGFPDLPQARNNRISIDPESLARLPDGSFFIGDEYGPYIYRFSAAGRLLAAIRPPAAFIPKRKGRDNFSSNNPGPGAVPPEPPDPESGRQNNQGFEGLSLTPGGRFLVVALQSATRQDSGATAETRRYTRLLYYDLLDLDRPVLVREHVVPLPVFENAQNKPSLAAQSELLALGENQFLLLCRDSGNGYGSGNATSRYRNIGLLDTSQATNIAGSPYDGSVPVAPDGKLRDEIAPATLMPFIDINDSVQLGKFGLHNGIPNDRNNLSEKWEGMTLVSVLDPANPLDYFLFVANDNDFITQSGYQAGASYSHPGGIEVDTMLLVYRISLPERLNYSRSR